MPPNVRGHVMEGIQSGKKQKSYNKIKYPHFVNFTKTYDYVTMTLEGTWVNESPQSLSLWLSQLYGILLFLTSK